MPINPNNSQLVKIQIVGKGSEHFQTVKGRGEDGVRQGTNTQG